MLKKVFRSITGRAVVFGALILIQLAVLIIGTTFLVQYYGYLLIALQILSWGIVISIISRWDNPMYKISWIIPILLVPVFGGFFYLMFRKHSRPSKITIHLKKSSEQMASLLEHHPEDVEQEIKRMDPGAYRQVYYLRTQAQAPIYKNTYTKLLTPGQAKWECMLLELEQARHYIFMEYFIVEEGIFWRSVLEILKRKVQAGVCVKLLYDDVGTITALDKAFLERVRREGIDCRVFNPFRPSLDSFMNYRDHRKICIIDGNAAITGGINLADEYINHKIKYGHWKDTSIILKGEAVWSLTILFLQVWGSLEPTKSIDYFQYKPSQFYPTDGYVQPFGDSPLDDSLIAEMTYINIINDAKKYVYIQTPYLILDNEMITALCVAAQSGIEICIITPSIGDKWFVHEVTRANYDVLVQSGIKIYEYTPGFIHAKTMVSDDKVAVVGTANFDFRSFYLHFECGVYLYRTTSVLSVRNDFFETKNCSRRITMDECRNVGFFLRITRAVLRVFSPLM